MEEHSKAVSGESSEFLGAGWFDPMEVGIGNEFVNSSRSSSMQSWTRR